MATRCFCPPESMCGALAAYSCMPTARSAASTRSRISCGFTPRFSRPKATSSSTIVATIWLSGFWKIMPTRWRTSQMWSSSRVS